MHHLPENKTYPVTITAFGSVLFAAKFTVAIFTRR